MKNTVGVGVQTQVLPSIFCPNVPVTAKPEVKVEPVKAEKQEAVIVPDAIAPVVPEIVPEAIPEPLSEVVSEPTVAIVEPVKPIVESPTPGVTTPRPGRYLSLGEGYDISIKAGSGYAILLRIMAQEGHFEEVIRMLEAGVDVSNMEQAKALLDKIFVSREHIEQLMRNDTEWKDHCAKKYVQLTSRAQAKDEVAEKTLKNEARITGDHWVGNIKEMFSVCVGSSSETASNRNVKKFKEAGITFRQYPVHPRRSDTVSLGMFPTKYVGVVREAIKTVYGVDEASIPARKKSTVEGTEGA